ncbi:MAG: class I SAM-dependent methyltransferase [Pseudomonadales bacterium]
MNLTDTSSHRDKHLNDAYGVYTLKKKHKLVKRLRKRSEPIIHGTKVWDSSYLVMDYLEKNPLAPRSRVMDLGCGWGSLSIYCAVRHQANVTAVDADENVFPYLNVQAALNDVTLKTKCNKFHKVSRKSLAKQDVVVGSDICFWDNMVTSLYKAIKKSLASGVRQVIIADPGRETFLKLAKKCEKKLDAELVEYKTSYPAAIDGYLLIISNSRN